MNKIYCPICNKETQIIITKQLRRGEGTVYHCKKCDHGFLENKIKNIKEYYDKEYRKKYSHKSEEASTNAKEIFETYSKYQTERIKYIKKFINKEDYALEVGASAGQFIAHIKDRVKKVDAIELDTNCAKFINDKFKIDVDTNELKHSKFRNNIYSCVFSFQVLEHTNEPQEFINELLSVTKKGGNIFLEFPNINDPLLSIWSIENYKKFFFHSAHLHYFSEKSIVNLLSKMNINENSYKIFYNQDYNILNHINWLINKKPQETCHPGLGEISLISGNNDIGQWLTNALQDLNTEYIEKLKKLKSTSNIVLHIKK